MNGYAETMLRDYIVCALWSSTDDGEPLDRDHGPEDLAEETETKMRADVQGFFEQAKHILVMIDMDPGQAGHDFWLTRNGHGTGFWDRGLRADGDKLTQLAHAWGETDLYVGDDGKVYC